MQEEEKADVDDEEQHVAGNKKEPTVKKTDIKVKSNKTSMNVVKKPNVK